MTFNIGDKVLITELQISGTVKTTFCGSRGWEYEIRYFNQGKAELVYFYETELEMVKNKCSER